MPITSRVDDLVAGIVLPSVPTMIEDLRVALNGRRVLSRDDGFVRDLMTAHQRGNATDRQTGWLERMWFRYAPRAIPLPVDVDAGINAINVLIGTMAEDRANFARDMITAVRDRSPTPAQWRAFCGLVEQAETFINTPPAPAGQPATLNVERLFAMFDAAARAPIDGRVRRAPRLQFPGLNVWRPTTGADRDVIMLTRPHSDPSRRTRLARITRQGEIVGGFSSRGSLLTAEQTDLVRRLCTSPEETLRDEGRRTGTCCMCARPLTDARSVALGMGPVCAARWGLTAEWLTAAGVTPTGRTVTTPTTPRAPAFRPMPAATQWFEPVQPSPVQGLAHTDLADVEARLSAILADTPAAQPVAERPRGWMAPAHFPDQEEF